jgi:hypothetical protein
VSPVEVQVSVESLTVGIWSLVNSAAAVRSGGAGAVVGSVGVGSVGPGVSEPGVVGLGVTEPGGVVAFFVGAAVVGSSDDGSSFLCVDSPLFGLLPSLPPPSPCELLEEPLVSSSPADCVFEFWAAVISGDCPS